MRLVNDLGTAAVRRVAGDRRLLGIVKRGKVQEVDARLENLAGTFVVVALCVLGGGDGLVKVGAAVGGPAWAMSAVL